MAVRNLAPTKTNLLELNRQLSFAKLGHELLDQKRNILVNELLRIVDQAEEQLSAMNETLSLAFSQLIEATKRTGTVGLGQIAAAIDIETEVRLNQRRMMGVQIPIVETESREHPPYFSSIGASVWIDASIAQFKKSLELAGTLAELKISMVRLAKEVRKTMRKVNALEKIAIPDLAETVQTISERLEEAEREMFVLMKSVKARLAAAPREER